MNGEDSISEREYRGRLDLPTSAFKTQLQPLRSLKTATKKRRALKKQPELVQETKPRVPACGRLQKDQLIE